MPNATAGPSANWQALKKQMRNNKRKFNGEPNSSRKRSKHEEDINTHLARSPSSSRISASTEPSPSPSRFPSGSSRNDKSTLKQMVLGHLEYSDTQKEPGKYLALDCEMVGVGIDGAESALARVSLVNYHGVVILDEYVRQKEHVVDYRTKWSGIRPKDLINARHFANVQQQVAAFLKDKVLVGHAIHNDLKALLLSHPRPMTRDTQFFAHKFGVCKSGRVALRDLVKQELGLTIQSGEHSSVTDARATMAVFRLHQKAWEKGIPRRVISGQSPVKAENPSRHGKKGNSSGLSTVVRRTGKVTVNRRTKQVGVQERAKTKVQAGWWRRLPETVVESAS